PPDEDPLEPEKEQENPPPLWLFLLLFVLLPLAAAVGRILYTLPKACDKRSKDMDEKYTVWVQALYDLLRTDKLVPSPHETPMAFTLRGNYTRAYPLSLSPAGEIISYISYSSYPVEQECIDNLMETFESLYLAFPWQKKVVFIFTRAFLPWKNRNCHLPKIKTKKLKKSSKKSR
ncbi:MAG: hypothetical protein GX786_02110, partial [Clostridiales bacterium]|nr:hypothetical protein [Clostridiales bacterium]